MLGGTILTIIGAVLTNRFSRMLGKSNTYATFLFLSAITTGLVYFLKPHHILLLFILQLITSFCVGPVSVLQWAIYTDTADYSEWKKGRRATGLIMAASLFALKLGVALGGATLAWILAGYGYQPNVQQTSEALQGIRLGMSIYPALIAIGGVVLMVFYPLNKAKMETIEMDLIERRKQYETETNDKE